MKIDKNMTVCCNCKLDLANIQVEPARGSKCFAMFGIRWSALICLSFLFGAFPAINCS